MARSAAEYWRTLEEPLGYRRTRRTVRPRVQIPRPRPIVEFKSSPLAELT